MTFNGAEGQANYARIIRLISHANHLKFIGNVFYGKINTLDVSLGTIIWGVNNTNTTITIENNKFYNGEIAIHLQGTSSTNLCAENIIRNNEFYNQNVRAIFLYFQDAPIISDNFIDIDRSEKHGIGMYYCDNAYRVTNNIIEMNYPNTVIYNYHCDGQPGLDGIIANNFVEIVGTGPSNTAHAIHLYASNNIQVYHNSVAIHGGTKETSTCFEQQGGGSNIDVRNNIFYNASGGYAAGFTNGGSISNTNNNDYYSNGNYIVRWGSNYIRDLVSLKALRSPFDDASLSVNPAFFSFNPIDLHTSSYFLKDAGTDLTAIVLEDIDGDSRSTTPCIGADEYTDVTGAPLSGIISIGTDESLKTISAAVDSMNLYGISGPVTFNIKDNASPYDEQIDIFPIIGADASNRVTFQPDPGNTGDVEIRFSGQTSSTPWVFRFNGAGFVTLKDLTLTSQNSTYPGVVFFQGNSNHDSILNCTINSDGSTPGTSAIWGSDVWAGDIAIFGNTINDAESGISFTGADDPGNYPGNITVSDNIINGQSGAGIYLERYDAPVVTNNTINSAISTTSYHGIDLRTCPSGVTLTGNTVICNDAGWGISLDSCDMMFGDESLIANNIIDVRGGTDTVNCIQTSKSNYVNIYYNTTRISSENSNENSHAYLNSEGSNIDIRNNIFCNFGLGRAYSNEKADAITISNNNALFTTGTFLAGWGNTDMATLADLQAASGMDGFSRVGNPVFTSADDLHPKSYFLDNGGVAISEITLDIDGVTRSDPPDFGAYEFSSPLTPMSGTYTIYGDSPDFSSIRQALDSLQIKGVSGPVELIIRSGVYDEHVGVIQKIPGASTTNNIVIRSESGNPEDVTISSAEVADHWEFRSVDHFTIRDLTIFSSTPTAGRALAFYGTSKNISILNNKLISANTAYPTISFIQSITDSIQISDNRISTVYRGISFYSNQDRLATNTLISGNQITGSDYIGIVLDRHTAPKVLGNTASRLYLRNCTGELLVSGNRIHFQYFADDQFGIFLDGCKGLELYPGLVSNNMVSVAGGNYFSSGIAVQSCEYINVYHNSVSMNAMPASTHTSAIAVLDDLIVPDSKNISILNNILSNSFDSYYSYAMWIEDITAVFLSDFNCIHNEYSDNLIWVYYDIYADIASFQTATGLDMNSIEVDPLFYSDTDLRSKQVALNQAATSLPEVTHDIDSVLRDPVNPDLGAAEFTCDTPSFKLYFIPHCLGDSTIIIDSSMNITAGSIRGWDFNGDLVPDAYSDHDFDTVGWLFEGSGIDSVSYIIDQIEGCRIIHTAQVPFAKQPELEITTKGAYCDADDGWATVTVTNLPGPFEYYWSDGQTTPTATDLSLGTYTVAVSEVNGCTTTEDVSIGEAIEVTVSQLQRSTCGVPNGSAVVTATGGFPPYDFVWSNGETNDTNNVLLPGTHYVNVIDNNGCYVLGSINIEGDGGPQVNIVDVAPNDCYGDKTGSIDIYVTGGVAPYEYLWSDGSITQDVDSLAAGVYHVTVEDRDGCQGSASIQVLQPAQINISTVVTPSACLGSDGVATAVVSGGTKPYTYDWSSGGTFPIEDGLAAGVYSVTVTDGNGCQMGESVLVGDVGAPVVSIVDVQGVGCSVTDNGSIDIDVTPAGGPYTYEWTTADGSGLAAGVEDQSGLTEGSYHVEVTDGAGCVGVNQASVGQEPPDVNPICLVTVDTATGMNLVIWEQIVTEDVSHYNIYRESSVREDYQLVGSVGYNEESIFLDSVADPSIRSWRYRLSVVDNCGNESELSDPHKTMHLTMNVGLDNSVNLIWDHYEGFPVTTYKIWRYDAISTWNVQADVPSNLTSYTDFNPINEDLTYYIEVDHPTGCTSTDKKASTLNSSRSNRKNKLKSDENQSPTDLTLDANSIDENLPTGTLVGRFTTEDPDEGDSHIYAFVAGAGGNDNGSFSISGDSLLTAEVFDYETNSTYSILVSTTDTGDLSVEKQFIIFVNDVFEPDPNRAPTGISLDVSIIDENKPVGTLIGRFTTTDPDAGDTHVYALASGLGGNDNVSFRIRGDSLLSNETFDYEANSTYSILVSTTDQGDLSYEKQFTIFINNVYDPSANKAPTGVFLDVSVVNENELAGTLVGRFTTSDPDVGDTHYYTLVEGPGSNNNSSFSISGDSLVSAEVFDYETKSTYSILVSTTDTGHLSFKRQITIFILDQADPVTNYAPTDITLDSSTVDENQPAGILIGRFTTTDEDVEDTHSYTLVSGVGGEDISSFSIMNDSLLTAVVFDYETKNSYSILVRTTDDGDGNLSYEESFVITINDIEVGIAPLSGQELRIYPNPFNHSTTIRFPNPDGKTYRMALTDLSGKVFRLADDITTSEYILKKGELKAGLYFIELRGPRVFRGKIVIE